MKATTKEAAAPVLPSTLEEKLERAIHLQHLIWNVKPLYAEFDELILALKKEKGKIPPIVEYKGRPYQLKLKNNFAGKNVAYGHGAVRRFELEIKSVKPKKSA